MKYTFNMSLLKNLCGLLNTNAFAMSKRMGMSVDTLRRHLTGKVACRVDILVAVCNEYHLDVHAFFLTEGEEWNAPVVVDDERWHPVLYHPEIIGITDKMYTCEKIVGLCEILDLDISQVMEQQIDTQADISDSARYCYFKELFQLLPTLLKVAHRQIGIDTGHTIHTYGASVKAGDILMRTLVDVCNAYSIPISLFFPKEGCMSVPNDICVNGLPAQEFHPYRIMEFYGNTDEYEYVYEFQSHLNFTPQRMLRYMSKTSPMKASELVDISNKLGVSPMYFLENSVEHVNSIGKEDVNRVMKRLKNEAERAKKESAMLQSRIRHMESMNEMKK